MNSTYCERLSRSQADQRASSNGRLLQVVMLASAFSTATFGADTAASKAEPTTLDRIWSYADLYKNEKNPVLQRLQFTGRFQLDYAIVDADQGDRDEWNIRRFRAGLKAKLFKDFTLHAEADLNPQEPYPVYTRLTDTYLSWSRAKSFVATIGKHSAPFTLDGSTSSKELLAIDRGNLANNLWFSNEYFPGVSASGQIEEWRYWAGVYSSGAANREFGEFNGGIFGLATIGYDFAKKLDAKQALLSFNYVYNEPDRHNSWTRNLQHVGSLNFNYAAAKWGFRTDLSAGSGYLGSGDLWGAMVMPYYNITDRLQVVARYTHLQSERRNGVRLALYESTVVPGRGDLYDEGYLGLNYYIYGHKLKLQTGVQYASMEDRARDGGEYSGWAWTSGLRLSW